MRILMTSDTVGGVWTYAMELCRALGAHGVEVALATMGAPVSAAQRSEVEQLRQVELFESHYKLEWMDDPWEDVDRAGRWMQELEERVRPDVIHLNGYAHGRQSWRAPVLMTAHSCVLSWWQAVKREPAPARWRHYRDAVREGLQRANLVVAPTAAMLGCIHEQYGIPRRARVIYNARDPSRFVSGRKEPIVLSAGRMWDEAKNLQALRAAAPSVPWRVYVAGDGGAEVKGPAGAVRLLGHLDGSEMARWMRRASIYALPARYEPFGLSILEAALSGCALVLGDIASLREVWGDAAVFVDPEDPGALGEQLQRLCTRPAERKALAMAAQRRAERYEPSRMAREYLDGMAEYGFSPATRVFEAAGAGACLISDHWKGLDFFLEPGTQVLVAEDGEAVVEHLARLTPQRAQEIGQAALKRVLAEHTYAHRAEQLEDVLDAKRRLNPAFAGAGVAAAGEEEALP